MLFTNKLLARCGEKCIATYTTHVHDVNHGMYSNIAAMYGRGRDAEIAIFPTAPEDDSPLYNFQKITVHQFESWNNILVA